MQNICDNKTLVLFYVLILCSYSMFIFYVHILWSYSMFLFYVIILCYYSMLLFYVRLIFAFQRFFGKWRSLHLYAVLLCLNKQLLRNTFRSWSSVGRKCRIWGQILILLTNNLKSTTRASKSSLRPNKFLLMPSKSQLRAIKSQLKYNS